MWDAIRSNQRRSRLMMALLAVVLLALGFAIGLTVDPQAGGPLGALIALAVYLVMLMAALFAGSDILLSAAGAHPIAKADHPRLWNIVEEMTIASGLPVMPAVYIIDDDRPNAFAVGPRPDKAVVAVTSGLLKRLTRDELQGVVAHEIGHIRNQDTRFMTLASVMVGAVTLLGEVFLRSLRFRGGGRRSSSRGGGQAQAVIFLIAILAAILAPVCAQILYFACSRRREFLADASAARFTRYPEGLASALEKISDRAAGATEISKAVAPMYIVNPLQEHAGFSLHSTHPPTELRVKILRSMGGRAGLGDYEAAYKVAQGGRGECLGRLTLSQAESVAARAPSPEPPEPREETIARAQEVLSVLGRIGQLLPIACACGVTVKVPPDFKGESVVCPRCGTRHPIPQAEPGGESSDTTSKPGRAAPPMTYTRREAGKWESFRCDCGQHIQLSPTFAGTHVHCTRCRRQVDILPGEGVRGVMNGMRG